ncbi:MAG: phospholipid carrier-dependent glycosyltransferase, partial [Chthoniobacteraceae bacterium]
ILRTGPTLIYDEPYHMDSVQRLAREGFTIEYLRGGTLSAPGPLYAVIHTVLRPLTHWQAPAIRLVNYGFLLATMALVWTALRLQHSPRALATSLSLLAAPTMWVISGLALTEMPAMTFAMLATVCLLQLPELCESNRGRAWAVAVLGGIAAGLAVTGRQPYLAVLLAAPSIANRRNWKAVLLFFAAGAVLPAMLFAVWGGTSPPQFAAATKGISIPHGILALAYGGAMTAIFTLRWFSLGWKWSAVAASAAVAANVAFGWVEIAPVSSLAGKFLPEAAMSLYARLASGLLVALSVLFTLSALKNLWERRDDRAFVFVCACGGLLCLTAMKVNLHFSSRYVATAMPWLLLASERYSEASWGKAARLVLGNALGLLMLFSYFDAHQ